jgi:membrane fusion protein, multidrug efflux system
MRSLHSSVVILALPLLLGACFERAEPTVENAVRPVQVVRVAIAGESDARAYAGTVQPRREADVAFRSPGRIAERLVDVGAHVTTGQVLARLDPVDLQLAVRSAEADLSSAQAQALQATSDAARSATLRAQGWQAAAVDETKQAAAKAAVERVSSARAALDLARNRLAYAELRSPADGVVTAVLLDQGTVVDVGTPVLRMAERGAPEIAVELPEQALPDAARPGATVTLWARPDQPITAALREIAPSAGGKLRTYSARYVLQGAPDWVALGMSATLHLPDGSQQAIAVLPVAALVDRGQGPMVWSVEDGGRLAARPVQVRRLAEDRVVVAGLTDGQQVVALGGQKLDPGTRVRITDTRPATE